MKSLFSPDSLLYRIVDRMINLILLNLLYLLFCIPIVTIGPATVALRYTTLKYAEDQEERVWVPFIHAFKQNFKQGMVLGLIATFVGIALAWSLWFNLNNDEMMNTVMLAMSALACAIYLMITAYIYPLMARYENSLKQMFRTAMVLAIRHLPATICLAILSAAPIVLMFYTFETFIIMLGVYALIGFSLVAFLHDKLIFRIFRQYTPLENTEE